MAQSANLTAFYNAYNNWLEAGAPYDPFHADPVRAPRSAFQSGDMMFSRKRGLCDALYTWAYHISEGAALPTDADDLEAEMHYQLATLNAEKCTIFPFGEGNYRVRFERATQHLCPNRIAWVKTHLAG